jgi:hypothetical protein
MTQDSDIIGILRGPKIDDFVIFDWVATIITAVGLNLMIGFNVFVIFLVLIIISIGLHFILGIDTKTNYLLGISKYPKRESSS